MCNWKFNFKGRTNNKDSFQSGAPLKNLFPFDCKGLLVREVLKSLVFLEKIEDVDAIFFYQLLLLIYTPQKSGIDGNHCQGYYEEVTKLNSLYVLLNKLDNCAYGHYMKLFELLKLVYLDVAVFQNDVLGESIGALANRWLKGAATFDSIIVNTITHRH